MYTAVCDVLVEGCECSEELRLCTVFQRLCWDSVYIAVVEYHDGLAASDGCCGEAECLAGRNFTACLNNFDMGEMGSGASNFKFFWRRHGI